MFPHTGELARRDPSTVAKLNPSIEALIADGFNTDSEHIKATASYTLGCMAVGNLKVSARFAQEGSKKTNHLADAFAIPVERDREQTKATILAVARTAGGGRQ